MSDHVALPRLGPAAPRAAGRDARVRRAAALSLLAPALLTCAGCATFPRAELDAYTASFQAAQTAASPLIADYGAAERALRWSVLSKEARFQPFGFSSTFKPDDAAAVATIGLPPTASALEGALRVIGLYNDTLLALAEGRNIEEARAQLGTIIGELGALTGGLGTGADLVVSPLITALRPAIEEANRQEFRRLVLDGYPKVVALIGLLREATTNQYEAIVRPLVLRADTAPPADLPAIREQIHGWHGVFGDYVVLLDSMQARLEDLRQVVLVPKREAPLARAARGAAELRAHADALKLSLSELHAPR